MHLGQPTEEEKGTNTQLVTGHVMTIGDKGT